MKPQNKSELRNAKSLIIRLVWLEIKLFKIQGFFGFGWAQNASPAILQSEQSDRENTNQRNSHWHLTLLKTTSTSSFKKAYRKRIQENKS